MDGDPNSYDNGNGSRIVQSGGPSAVSISWSLSYGARSNQAAVALEPAPSGSTEETTYYYANSELIAKKNPDSSIYYYHNDHLGSTGVLSDESGNVAEETKYGPWGEIMSGGTKSKFLYTGQEHDDETGLNYYNARYYNSSIRRFTQADDIIQDIFDPQTLNRYTYVHNNPLRYTDPSGHQAFEILRQTMFWFSTGIPMMTAEEANLMAVMVYGSDQDFSLNDKSREVIIAPMILPMEAVNSGNITLTEASLRMRQNYENGKMGERQVQKAEPKAAPQFRWNNIPGFNTSRIHDFFTRETKKSTEVKVGYQTLTKANQLQIDKDAALRNAGLINTMEYRFLESPVTGKKGASKPYQDALRKAGLWYNPK